MLYCIILYYTVLYCILLYCFKYTIFSMWYRTPPPKSYIQLINNWDTLGSYSTMCELVVTRSRFVIFLSVALFRRMRKSSSTRTRSRFVAACSYHSLPRHVTQAHFRFKYSSKKNPCRGYEHPSIPWNEGRKNAIRDCGMMKKRKDESIWYLLEDERTGQIESFVKAIHLFSQLHFGIFSQSTSSILLCSFGLYVHILFSFSKIWLYQMRIATIDYSFPVIPTSLFVVVWHCFE